MKINDYLDRSVRSLCVNTLVVVLLILSGCGKTPQPDSLEKVGNPSDAKTGVDNAKSENKPIAESQSQLQASAETQINKPSADVLDFWDAAFNGKIEAIRKGIESGVNVDAADDQQRTALMWAAFNGHTAVVKLLLKKGAVVDSLDAGGRTALLFAATGVNEDTVEVLLDAGAKINAVDSGEGFTPLMHAAAEGQVKVVQVLLKHKADTSIRDVDGDTALDFARQKGHAEVVRLLSK